jgi:hypothetical protein
MSSQWELLYRVITWTAMTLATFLVAIPARAQSEGGDYLFFPRADTRRKGSAGLGIRFNRQILLGEGTHHRLGWASRSPCCYRITSFRSARAAHKVLKPGVRAQQIEEVYYLRHGRSNRGEPCLSRKTLTC